MLCIAGDVKKLLLTIHVGCEKPADKWQNLESKKNFHIFFYSEQFRAVMQRFNIKDSEETITLVQNQT